MERFRSGVEGFVGKKDGGAFLGSRDRRRALAVWVDGYGSNKWRRGNNCRVCAGTVVVD